MLSGNRNIMHHITEHNHTPETAPMRVFEVDFEQYPRVQQDLGLRPGQHR
ncbi:hypothetical protein [Propionivibrio sp.]